MRPLKPFFSYFGSKYRLAPYYPRPEYELIVEPFAGSAGYSLYYSDHDVRLNDANPTVASVWQYLTSTSVDRLLALPTDIDSTDGLPISQSERALIGYWLGSALAHPRTTRSKWARRPDKANWSATTRERIISQLPAIRHWKVSGVDYRAIPNVKAVWFVDPPYKQHSKWYPTSAIDYDHLAKWCRTRKGQVIVCEAEGADWLPFRHFRQGRKSTGHARGGTSEVVWLS